MLSYRHEFHAGNHADILKHTVLCLLLRAMCSKDKPFSLLDTHSGGGIYSMRSGFAAKNEEYKTGLSKIINNRDLQRAVPEYFACLNKLRDQDESLMPGSPYIEASLARDCDKLTFIDLHPAEYENLKKFFYRDDRVNVQNRNGLEAVSALLPPTPRRGLCFIDPPYEEKNEYYETAKAVKKGLQRWATGVFAVWYPVLGRMSDHSKELTQELRRLNFPLLQAELCVEKQSEERGMCGSGMLIVNYPFRLDKELTELVDILYKTLCSDEGSAKVRIINPQP